MLIAVHVAAGLVALLTGGVQVVLRKGSRRHRLVGRGYVAAMAVLLVSSFGIYELRDGPSVFHAVTVVAAALVAAGWLAARRMPTAGALRWHLLLMQASYLVLILTFVAQFRPAAAAESSPQRDRLPAAAADRRLRRHRVVRAAAAPTPRLSRFVR